MNVIFKNNFFFDFMDELEVFIEENSIYFKQPTFALSYQFRDSRYFFLNLWMNFDFWIEILPSSKKYTFREAKLIV
jgi:hypothetical protein